MSDAGDGIDNLLGLITKLTALIGAAFRFGGVTLGFKFLLPQPLLEFPHYCFASSPESQPAAPRRKSFKVECYG